MKFSVPEDFVLPPLDRMAPEGGSVLRAPERRLSATYYDAGDLRLARAGVTLRYRLGEPGPPWHLKLPTDQVNVREEVTAEGAAGVVPEELTALVAERLGTEGLRPVVRLRTDREVFVVRDAEGTVLAEIVDDAVTVDKAGHVTDQFRELEVERKADTRAAALAVTAVARELREAGATSGEFVPKAIRALGLQPPYA